MFSFDACIYSLPSINTMAYVSLFLVLPSEAAIKMTSFVLSFVGGCLGGLSIADQNHSSL